MARCPRVLLSNTLLRSGAAWREIAQTSTQQGRGRSRELEICEDPLLGLLADGGGPRVVSAAPELHGLLQEIAVKEGSTWAFPGLWMVAVP
jgi:hypothetical protein